MTRRSVSERFWAKVDKSGDCWEWTATKTDDGYGLFWVGTRSECAHRVIYEWTHGPIGPGLKIDHTCHNTGCVNPAHLRKTTHKQNLENLLGANRNNQSSGVRGVYWSERLQKWGGQVGHNSKRYHVGVFATLKEASAAVSAKRNELHTHNDVDRVA